MSALNSPAARSEAAPASCCRRFNTAGTSLSLCTSDACLEDEEDGAFVPNSHSTSPPPPRGHRAPLLMPPVSLHAMTMRGSTVSHRQVCFEERFTSSAAILEPATVRSESSISLPLYSSRYRQHPTFGSPAATRWAQPGKGSFTFSRKQSSLSQHYNHPSRPMPLTQVLAQQQRMSAFPNFGAAAAAGGGGDAASLDTSTRGAAAASLGTAAATASGNAAAMAKTRRSAGGSKRGFRQKDQSPQQEGGEKRQSHSGRQRPSLAQSSTHRFLRMPAAIGVNLHEGPVPKDAMVLFPARFTDAVLENRYAQHAWFMTVRALRWAMVAWLALTVLVWLLGSMALTTSEVAASRHSSVYWSFHATNAIRAALLLVGVAAARTRLLPSWGNIGVSAYYMLVYATFLIWPLVVLCDTNEAPAAAFVENHSFTSLCFASAVSICVYDSLFRTRTRMSWTVHVVHVVCPVSVAVLRLTLPSSRIADNEFEGRALFVMLFYVLFADVFCFFMRWRAELNERRTFYLTWTRDMEFKALVQTRGQEAAPSSAVEQVLRLLRNCRQTLDLMTLETPTRGAELHHAALEIMQAMHILSSNSRLYAMTISPEAAPEQREYMAIYDPSPPEPQYGARTIGRFSVPPLRTRSLMSEYEIRKRGVQMDKRPLLAHLHAPDSMPEGATPVTPTQTTGLISSNNTLDRDRASMGTNDVQSADGSCDSRAVASLVVRELTADRGTRGSDSVRSNRWPLSRCRSSGLSPVCSINSLQRPRLITCYQQQWCAAAYAKMGREWQIDFIELAMALTGGRGMGLRSDVLVMTGERLLEDVELYGLHLPSDAVRNFLTKIQNLYMANPYHNRIHGAMVAHAAVVVSRAVGLWDESARSQSVGLDYISLVLAALAHDVGHPGRSNAFFVNTDDTLATIYNDTAVLENLHSCLTFTVMARQGNCLLAELPTDSLRLIRKRIISLILATDMAQHFEWVAKFRVRRSCEDLDLLTNVEDISMVLRMCIKLADVGHAMVSWDSHLRWGLRVTEEFYQQGEAEAALNLPRSPLCDRALHPGFAKSQKGFLQFVVEPFLREMVPMNEPFFRSKLCEPLEDNIAAWDSRTSQYVPIPKEVSDLRTSTELLPSLLLQMCWPSQRAAGDLACRGQPPQQQRVRIASVTRTSIAKTSSSTARQQSAGLLDKRNSLYPDFVDATTSMAATSWALCSETTDTVTVKEEGQDRDSDGGQLLSDRGGMLPTCRSSSKRSGELILPTVAYNEEQLFDPPASSARAVARRNASPLAGNVSPVFALGADDACLAPPTQQHAPLPSVSRVFGPVRRCFQSPVC